MIFWKIGELAHRTGLSVRMLRHYDEIGLCRPAKRSAAGYRLYSEADLHRLQQVVSLRQLGLSLEEVRICLDGRQLSAEQVIELQLERLNAMIARQQKLRSRLVAILERLRMSENISPDDLIQLIEETTMFEKYYTPEQLDELRQRADDLGPEGMQKAQEDWTTLIEEVRIEMEKGTDPAEERVLELARRWNGLIAAFTGGNPEIRNSLDRLWEEQRNELSSRHGPGLDPRMMEYIGQARAKLP